MLKLEIINIQNFPEAFTSVSVGKIETYINFVKVKGKVRGAIYPISLKSFEEYQLPLSGVEHFVICLEGEISVVERQSGQKSNLSRGELIRVSRKGAKEYPNLQIKSLERPSQAYWIPIHTV